METQGQPLIIEEVEIEKVIQPSQNDDADKEQPNEKQSAENTTKARANLPIPYPQRLKKHKLDKQFTKFMEVFKNLHINIPFADALEQMPSYVKFMKDILSQKRRLADFETVNLTEECSAILQRKLPQKLKDPAVSLFRAPLEMLSLRELFVIWVPALISCPCPFLDVWE